MAWLALFLALASSIMGCSEGWRIYGATAEFADAQKAATKDLSSRSPGPVTVQGTVGEVCPMGCWFYLLDEKSLTRVELDASRGFVIPSDSTGREVLVQGELSQRDGVRTLRAQSVWLR